MVDEVTWIPSGEFVDIYSIRREHLAELGIDVSGLDAALAGARTLRRVGVVTEHGARARFIGEDGGELGTIVLPASG